MARFGAVLDACVLVPVSLADTLLRLAEYELYRPIWSQKILEEVRSAILDVHPTVDPGRVDARLHAMNDSFEDACVEGWDPLIDGLKLPDPDDRHVVAAAIRGRADLIVTRNLKDYPDVVLTPLGLDVLSPDEFLLHQMDLAPQAALSVLREQAAATSRPPMTVDDVLESLDRAGAPMFAAQARGPQPDEGRVRNLRRAGGMADSATP